MTGNYLVIFLGAFAIFWYNIVYTPLKMKSALAIIPGALVGSIPPFIGWTAGGGDIMNPPVWALALFFFIWQIPHFWLLLMVYEDDYKKAGFPVLTEIFSIQQLKRITFIWIAALAATCMMFPLFHIGSNNLLTDILLFAAGIWLIWRTKSLISYYFKTKPIRLVFVDINMYVLAVAMLLFIDKLILK
ncbi:MAG: heme o synthase [Bacteroidota bacterium]|nr:heme o synthase [Bacteroidota bacterium]